MLKNILGKEGNKEVNDEDLKKLREQFKQIAEDKQNTQNPATSEQNTQQPTQEQQKVMADPQRVEENERVTNLIMQQIKELIEIDNNLNVKIKEIETKLKTNMSATQDIKQVVDKFHQRLEFIEKNMEKFMGLYEVVTNRFNPFVEEEQKEKIENPTATGKPNIPDTDLTGEGNSQGESKEESSTQTFSNTQTQPEGQQTNEQASGPQTNEQTQAEESQAQQQTQQTREQNPAQQSQKINQPDDTNPQENKTAGAKLLQEAGLSGKLDSEPEQELIKRLDNILNKQDVEETTLKNIKSELSSKVNSLVVDTIKEHRKVTKDEVNKTVDEIENNFDLSSGESTQAETSTQSNSKLEAEVPKDYQFTLPDGTEIKSIADLKQALTKMDGNTFSQHVNEQGNDFGQWLGLVTGDQSIAEKFSSLKDRQQMISELEKLG